MIRRVLSFLKKIMDGLKARMGQLTKPNLALSIPLLKMLILKAENQWKNIKVDLFGLCDNYICYFTARSRGISLGFEVSE